MRFRLLIVLAAFILVSGCAKVSQATDGPSFREQLCELVQLRDEGTISEQEYRSHKHRVFNLLMH